MRASLYTLFAASFVVSCTTVTVTEAPKVDEKVGRIPSMSLTSAATVGSPVFSQFRYWAKIGYRVRQDANIPVGGGQVVVSDGDFLVKAIVENVPAYCTEKAAFGLPILGPRKTACFLDKEGRGYFDKVKVAADALWWEKDVAPPIRYEQAEEIFPKSESFKYELLYQGMSKGTLRLAYREYFNDFARPSYFQDVSYDVNTFPADVTFRSVRLHIISADNNNIRYQVLSGF